jgi:outer membrane protein OmpA-like peptidoglycan-associated protein
MNKKNLFASFFYLFLITIQVSAQQDIQGSSDPALFPSRIPGFYIESYETNDYGVSQFTKTNGELIEAQGKKTVIKYQSLPNAKKVSSAYIALNYQVASKKLNPSQEFIGDLKTFYCAEIKNGGINYWMQVTSYVGEGSAEATESYMIVIIEKSLMEQVISAAEIQSNLKSTGHVALYILFDTGAATIKQESKPAIKEIAGFLKKNPAMKAYIVGHTDNQGNSEANIKLSLDRANAVMNELITLHQIQANQLTAKGVGSLCPIASNDTEDGKKQNRRVELVKQ